MKDYVRTLIDVRSDQAGLVMRRRVTQAAILAISALGAGTCVIAATLMFVNGLAGGLSALFQGRPWLGDLASGALLLGLVSGGIAFFLARRDKTELTKQIEKYERIHNQHRAEHGHHVSDPPPPAH